MRRVGYIGEGAFSKRLPYVGFFWFFSCRSRKEHYRTDGYNKVYFIARNIFLEILYHFHLSCAKMEKTILRRYL